MGNNKKDQLKKEGQPTGKPTKKKSFITDKKLYIIIAVLICLFVVTVMVIPRAVNYVFTNSLETAMSDLSSSPTAEKDRGFFEKIGDKMSSKITGNFRGVIKTLKDKESEYLADLPEDIRNKTFANSKEKAAFYVALMEKYNENSESGELPKGMTPKQFSSLNTLSSLYSLEAHAEELKENKPE